MTEACGDCKYGVFLLGDRSDCGCCHGLPPQVVPTIIAPMQHGGPQWEFVDSVSMRPAVARGDRACSLFKHADRVTSSGI